MSCDRPSFEARPTSAAARAAGLGDNDPSEAPRSHATLIKALVAAQRGARAVEKKARNAFHGYNYASADAIIDEASEALAMEGLATLPVSVGRDPEQPDHVWQGEGEDSWIATPRRILAVFKLVHESGEEREFRFTSPVMPEKGRPEDKAEFGARTEGLGYALRDLLLIPRVDMAQNTPSARDDSSYKPRAPAAKAPAPSAPAPQPVRERPWMKRLQVVVGKLRLGENEANERGLKGKPRDDFEREARVAYLRWCAGRADIKSTLDLTDAEADLVIRRAELGEVPQ